MPGQHQTEIAMGLLDTQLILLEPGPQKQLIAARRLAPIGAHPFSLRRYYVNSKGSALAPKPWEAQWHFPRMSRSSHPTPWYQIQEAGKQKPPSTQTAGYAQRYFSAKSVRLSETPGCRSYHETDVKKLKYNRDEKCLIYPTPKVGEFHACIHQAVGCIQPAPQ